MVGIIKDPSEIIYVYIVMQVNDVTKTNEVPIITIQA